MRLNLVELLVIQQRSNHVPRGLFSRGFNFCSSSWMLSNVRHGCNRADNAMQAYRGALGELREDMQASPFAAWTLEQLQVRRSPLQYLSQTLNLKIS